MYKIYGNYEHFFPIIRLRRNINAHECHTNIQTAKRISAH